MIRITALRGVAAWWMAALWIFGSGAVWPQAAEEAKPADRRQKLLLAHYYYWFQGDIRKDVPFARVRAGDGTSLLTDKPMGGTGPWFSYDFTQWHREQIRDARRAGIDVLLPVYRGASQDRATYALKGLDVLVQALKETKAEQKDYPLVGMSFDTSSLAEDGSRPDLARPEGQREFYSHIRAFFTRIPPEFRAQVILPGQAVPACVVVLRGASDFAAVSEEAFRYAERQFKEEFGKTLAWVGGSDFKAKGVALDGYCDFGPWQAARFDGSGRIAVAALSPGYNDSTQPASLSPPRPRAGGTAYKADWSQALIQKPDWVIIESFNGYHDGSEVAPTRQYGLTYLDLTRLGSLSLHNPIPYQAKFARHTAPEVIAPRSVCLVDFTIRNVGAKLWRSLEGTALSYRWFKDGQPFEAPAASVPVPRVVQPGQSIDMSLGIATLQADGSPMPEGRYELRVDMAQGAGNWFSLSGSVPLSLPVTVGKPPQEMAATVLSSALPTMMKQGSLVKTEVRVRNDGSRTWRLTDGVALGYRWVRTGILNGEAPAVVDPEGGRQAVAGDVAPGEVARFEVLAQAADHMGAPLPVWSAKGPWVYQIQWDLYDGKQWLNSGKSLYTESVEVLREDIGAFFLQSSAPKTMLAGSSHSLKAFLQNRGSERWTPEATKITYHWYYLDGIEAFWPGSLASIPFPTGPEQLTNAAVELKAPPGPGEYLLVWDVQHNGVWASSSANSRGTALLVVPVLINGGPQQFVDLSAVYDTDGISSTANLEDGSFDGAGNSLPAELMPPEVPMVGMEGKWYPSGYWGPVDRSGWDSCRLIQFSYPPKTDGVKNVVTCRGQGGTAPKGYYYRAHILGAAIAPNAVGDFTFEYETGNAVAVRMAMSQWNEPPQYGERIGFTVPYRHTAKGIDMKSPATLFHYVLPIVQDRPLTAIRLPDNPHMKIVAITLERQ
ncbi:MAG: hypothetical protein IT210_03485 [Armatimonadetes bacterium]|nr:hypothetical protein [Armatimonadota bacterium]